MQLYARDKQQRITSADNAAKKEDYICFECNTAVRVRGGLHRRKHFYHTTPVRICKLQGKSLTHLQVQCTIQQLLPEGECFLERRFNEIDRIADVCWESKKIIFEVQCSPISPEEIQERNADYGKLGYQVVWILHDNRYGNRRGTAVEQVLCNQLHYYTNIDIHGVGVVYDKIRGLDDIFPVNVASIYHTKNQKMYFEGDLKDLVLRKQLTAKQLELLNKGWQRLPPMHILNLLTGTIQNIYFFFFRLILESACKS